MDKALKVAGLLIAIAILLTVTRQILASIPIWVWIVGALVGIVLMIVRWRGGRGHGGGTTHHHHHYHH